MPTPVSAARQCLTPEAAQALEEAVGVARRRVHAQTTSLHAVSAFLALPSSSLREACTRARSSSYSPRLQFKALELCFSVALDRLPSSQALDEPPISNSLMAAIRRSQANQRRHPESFHFHQQQQQQQQQQHSSLSCVKVELRQLILSILDDPVVSRVFAEAGFRSCDIKLAIVRPPTLPLSRYPRRCPPIFLCNLTGGDSESGRPSFNFPFPGFSGFSGLSDVDDNCKRIGEILAKKSARNPLLVGVCAHDAVRSFAECVQRKKPDVLPAELSDLSFICIEKEVSEFILATRIEDSLDLRFEELSRSVGSCSGSGVILNIGDLKGFIADSSVDVVNYLVSQLTKLLKLYHGHLWLMAEAASYETYLKFLRRFPSIEKDWDLQVLPITSLKPSTGLYSRPQSLTESFVPFGGFFSAPSDLKGPLSGTSESVSHCHLCNEKYEQELSDILKGGCTVSVGDQCQSSLSARLHAAEMNLNHELDIAKRKWNDFCLHHHQSCRKAEVNTYQAGSRSLPTVVGFPFAVDGIERNNGHNGNCKNASLIESGCEGIIPSMSMNLERRVPTPELNRPISVVPKSESDNFLSRLQVTPSKSKNLEAEGIWSPQCTPSSSNVPDGHASPSSATSVRTDLGLGSLYACTNKGPEKPTCLSLKEHLQDSSYSSPTKIDVVNHSVSNRPAQSPTYPAPDLTGAFDPIDFKNLLRGLMDKVGRQDEAIYAISESIIQCRTEGARCRGTNLKGDMWFNFLGPDRVAKKRISLALAEEIFGSEYSLICVDLSSQDGSSCSNKILDCHDMSNYDVKFRGKTVVDFLAGELSKNPLSVVFIENIEKADPLAQRSLSSAIRTGKFSDSRGREVGINNVIFVVASTVTKGMKTPFSRKEPVNFSEERILGARPRQMQIFIGGAHNVSVRSNNSNVLFTPRKGNSGLLVNKRKLVDPGDLAEQHETFEVAKRAHRSLNISLDLNLPVEELEANDTENRNYDSDTVSENSEAWLEEFFNQMDETVNFKPFDFDALADKILKEINKSFCKTIGCDGLLEIDAEVMEQILEAAWSSDRYEALEDWVNNVLGRCFAEARQRYSFLVRSVLKLVPGEELSMEEQAPGIRLPAQIILN
ncbi:protein SMAX1-LIKE 6-like isoform X2 [Macadamia integrifolia]|uniref:protein SMAX1-LIKE 6-like isoform X2 n=1 Tax=Macadamia integrifolia TaxID=60698 RepID=UPI001C4E9C3B|nr:protein SMAX1-LIKE 6-like isoform X2 [Macadamia integrifolia]